MKIVFTEIQSWEKEILAKKFPDAVFIEGLFKDDNSESWKDAEIFSCFVHSQVTKEILEKMPNLKYITTRSTGFDNIDLAAAKERNIPVSNVPEYGSNTVAEFTFALLLDLTRNITKSTLQAKQINFDHTSLRGIDLNEKTIGIIGLGKIGMNVLKIAQGFGMKALVWNRSQDNELAQKMNFSYVDLDTLVKNADVITLHLPLTNETQHTINTTNILNFKKGSYLINTARGGLIDTQAIILGLEKEILAGVGLDVLEDENELTEELALLSEGSPSIENLKILLDNHILLSNPKVLITPHNAFNSMEALIRILNTTIENIEHFQNNTIQNLAK